MMPVNIPVSIKMEQKSSDNGNERNSRLTNNNA